MKIPSFFFCLGCLFLCSAAHAEKRALVMGNATYLKDGRPNPELALPRSASDAKAVADTLRQLGFAVHGQGPVLNASNQAMTEAIERFTQSIKPGDEVVLYFSGHGLSTDAGGNFLVPVDAPALDLEASDFSLVKNYQSVDLTLKALQARKPRLVVAILDACRSYPTRQVNAKLGNASTAGLNTRYQPDNGQLVMYAASHGRAALSWIDANDKDPHSVYTRVLIEEMQRPAPSISAMADRVQQRVWTLTAHRTQQQGGPQAPEYVNKLYAPFSFVPVVAQATADRVTKDLENENAQLRRQLAEREKTPAAPLPLPATPAPSPAPPPNTPALLHGRYQIVAGGSEVKDVQTGLTWARCSVGQSWNGSSCAGAVKTFTFDQAQKLAGHGWRVPTVRELHSLVWCSSGKTQDRDDLNDGSPLIANTCQGQYQSPTIRSGAFPAINFSWFRTSSSYVGNSNSNFAWVVDFYRGTVNYPVDIDLRLAVRLVRASQ